MPRLLLAEYLPRTAVRHVNAPGGSDIAIADLVHYDADEAHLPAARGDEAERLVVAVDDGVTQSPVAGHGLELRPHKPLLDRLVAQVFGSSTMMPRSRNLLMTCSAPFINSPSSQ